MFVCPYVRMNVFVCVCVCKGGFTSNQDWPISSKSQYIYIRDTFFYFTVFIFNQFFYSAHIWQLIKLTIGAKCVCVCVFISISYGAQCAVCGAWCEVSVRYAIQCMVYEAVWLTVYGVPSGWCAMCTVFGVRSVIR